MSVDLSIGRIEAILAPRKLVSAEGEMKADRISDSLSFCVSVIAPDKKNDTYNQQHCFRDTKQVIQYENSLLVCTKESVMWAW